MTFEAVSYVRVKANGNQTNLTFASLNRSNNGLLIVNGVTGNLGDTGTTKERIFSAAAVPTVNFGSTTIVAPYILQSGGSQGSTADFMSYDPTNGLTVFTGYVAAPAMNDGSEVVSTPAAAVNGTWNVLGLKTTGNLAGTGTINVGSGGMILSGTVAPAVNLGNAEGIIFATGGALLNGAVSNTGTAGLTVSNDANGGNVTLANTTNNFKGTITINNGMLAAYLDYAAGGGSSSLGNNTNGIFLNGGMLYDKGGIFLGSSRTVTLGPSGGAVDPNGNTLTVEGLISGTGILGTGNGTLVIAGSTNNYSGGTNVWSGGNLTASDGAVLGSGGLLLDAGGATANLHGNTNLSSTALGAGGPWINHQLPVRRTKRRRADRRRCRKPGTATQDTTLTLGGGNTSSVFYGSIGQTSTLGLAGTGVGSLAKQGSGTLTLTGPNTFTGFDHDQRRCR